VPVDVTLDPLQRAALGAIGALIIGAGWFIDHSFWGALRSGDSPAAPQILLTLGTAYLAAWVGSAVMRPCWRGHLRVWVQEEAVESWKRVGPGAPRTPSP
jgi:hypothetical protein